MVCLLGGGGGAGPEGAVAKGQAGSWQRRMARHEYHAPLGCKDFAHVRAPRTKTVRHVRGGGRQLHRGQPSNCACAIETKGPTWHQRRRVISGERRDGTEVSYRDAVPRVVRLVVQPAAGLYPAAGCADLGAREEPKKWWDTWHQLCN